jgi:hypothetical protein
VLQVRQHRRRRQTPSTFAIAPFGRLLRPTVAYGDGYSIPPIPGVVAHALHMEGIGVYAYAYALRPPTQMSYVHVLRTAYVYECPDTSMSYVYSLYVYVLPTPVLPYAYTSVHIILRPASMSYTSIVYAYVYVLYVIYVLRLRDIIYYLLYITYMSYS